uniref:Uncharacterized protein n=1 Tax=Arion vulgaris TaxID=1028688 RepID=A0A0B7BTW7_9EUPU
MFHSSVPNVFQSVHYFNEGFHPLTSMKWAVHFDKKETTPPSSSSSSNQGCEFSLLGSQCQIVESACVL